MDWGGGGGGGATGVGQEAEGRKKGKMVLYREEFPSYEKGFYVRRSSRSIRSSILRHPREADCC